MGTILTDYSDFERGQATRAWARLRVASWKTALAATRKVRPPEEAGAGASHTAPAEPQRFETDVCGSPSESFDWRQYRAVVEARRRDG